METLLIVSMLPSWTKCWKAVALQVIWETMPLLWRHCACVSSLHYSDTIMIAMASQITGVSFICSTACSGADQRKHHSSASLAFVWGIHRWPVDSPHNGPVTRNMFPRHHGIELNWDLFTHISVVLLDHRIQSRLPHCWEVLWFPLPTWFNFDPSMGW